MADMCWLQVGESGISAEDPVPELTHSALRSIHSAYDYKCLVTASDEKWFLLSLGVRHFYIHFKTEVCVDVCVDITVKKERSSFKTVEVMIYLGILINIVQKLLYDLNFTKKFNYSL